MEGFSCAIVQLINVYNCDKYIHGYRTSWSNANNIVTFLLVVNI